MPDDCKPKFQVSRAPPPIRPIRGSVFIPRPQPPASEGLLPSEAGFIRFGHIAWALWSNSTSWRLATPREAKCVGSQLSPEAVQTIADALVAGDCRAAGSSSYDGSLVWAPAATWRLLTWLNGREVSATLAALMGKPVEFPLRKDRIGFYPMILSRDLSLLFGAENPPPAPPKANLDRICEDKLMPSASVLGTTQPDSSNPRGPEPQKSTKVINLMVTDYAGREMELMKLKQEALATQYGVVRSTAKKCRVAALQRLEETATNSDITPTIDK